MKVFKCIPVLAVALLIPSFVAAEHSDRGRSRQYSDRDSSDWSTYGRRTGHDRDYDRGHGRDYDRGYNRGRNHKTTYERRRHGHHDDHYYCDHRSHDRYGHSRHGSHRRGRRGIHFGGVIVIRF